MENYLDLYNKSQCDLFAPKFINIISPYISPFQEKFFFQKFRIYNRNFEKELLLYEIT